MAQERPFIFEWSDKSIVNPKFWAEHQPDNYAKNCLALDGNADFFVDRKACYYENNFICEYEASSCGEAADNWISFGNYCIKFFLSDARNWTEANSTCEQNGAYLLTLNDDNFKLNHVQAYLKNLKLGEYENYFWV